MINDDPQNNNNQQGETVESIPLVTLLENPDSDFNVVVEKRSKDMPVREELAADATRSAPPKPETEQA